MKISFVWLLKTKKTSMLLLFWDLKSLSMCLVWKRDRLIKRKAVCQCWCEQWAILTGKLLFINMWSALGGKKERLEWVSRKQFHNQPISIGMVDVCNLLVLEVRKRQTGERICGVKFWDSNEFYNLKNL